jgi:hypothetical protein
MLDVLREAFKKSNKDKEEERLKPLIRQGSFLFAQYRTLLNAAQCEFIKLI